MVNVLLLNPPAWYYTGEHNHPLPILSLAYLSSVLRDAGNKTAIIDLEALQLRPDQVGKLPALCNADVIGITCLSIQSRGVQELIGAIRKVNPKQRIVVGGAHATARPEECWTWGADLVVTGECEGNIVELLESGATGIQPGKSMPIDEIPLPDWNHHAPNITTYAGQYNILRPRTAVMLWTRGCPYKCIFCGNIIFNNQPKHYRSPSSIADEMADLKRRGFEKVFVYDDELVGSPVPDGWMREIADRIAPLGMQWICQARCSRKHISVDLLKEMKRAGCRLILWGIESMSQKVLTAIRKGTTPEDNWRSLEMAKAAGIQSSAFTMIGNYMETETDLLLTAKALQQAYQKDLLQYRQTFVAKLMPGTEFERLAKLEGWYSEPEHRGLYMKRVEKKGTKWLTSQQIHHWQERFAELCPLPSP